MNRKALIVYGGWDGHSPKEGAEFLGALLDAEGFSVEKSDSLDAFLRAAEFDLVVPNWTMGEISGEQLKAVGEAVASGTGLAGWHGGMGDAFRAQVGWHWLTGGQFVAHPGNIIDYTVDIVDTEHEITRDLSPSFALHSEQYYMVVDPGVKVLARTTFSGEHDPDTKGVQMPVVWVKQRQKGRVFYNAVGHHAEDWHEPTNREIMRRGLLWAARV